MTDELLFSALGLTMDTSIERQLFSPTNLPNDYEVSCATPFNDDFGILDGQLNVTNPTDCYTDLTCSPQSSWNDWSTTNTPTSSGIFNNNLRKIIIKFNNTTLFLVYRERIARAFVRKKCWTFRGRKRVVLLFRISLKMCIE